MFFPKQYFVGIRTHSKLGEGDKFHLGFPTPEGTDAAADKRKATVKSWTNQTEWEWEPETRTSKPTKHEGKFITIDNVPTDGFRLVGDVKRYGGWFSNGNVVWRVEDPRGFQFEISSANLGSLLAVMTIDKGVIVGKCLYARDGARNALIAENTEEYQATLASTTRRDAAASFSLKDLKPGDDITLVDGTSVRYWGKVWVLKQESIQLDDDSVTQWTGKRHTRPAYNGWKHAPVERYLLQHSSDTFSTVSRPNVASRSERLSIPPIETAEQACQAALATGALPEPVITTKKFTLKDIKYDCRKLDISEVFMFRKFSNGVQGIVQKATGLVFCIDATAQRLALPVGYPWRHQYNPAWNNNVPEDIKEVFNRPFVAFDKLFEIERNYYMVPGYQRKKIVPVVRMENGSILVPDTRQDTYLRNGWEGIIRTNAELAQRYETIKQMVQSHPVWYQAVIEVNDVAYPYGEMP